MFEISIQVKKQQVNFLNNIHAQPEVKKSGHNKKMRKQEFFNLVKVIIEKQVSKIQKSENLMFEVSFRVKKW